MSEVARLRESGASEFERFLLDSAADEEPSPEVDAILMAGLGPVGPGLLAPAASDPHAAALVSQTTAQPMSMLLYKVGALGLVVGGFLSVSAWLNGAPQQAAARAEVAPTVAAREAAPAPAQPSEGLPLATPPAQAVQQAPALHPSAARHTDPGAADSLHEELVALERAKTALEKGDADRALGLLASYERKFPRGTLRQEATVLRVRALRAQGSEQQAAELSATFLEQNPSSAHAPRLEAQTASKP